MITHPATERVLVSPSSDQLRVAKVLYRTERERTSPRRDEEAGRAHCVFH